MPHHAEMRSLVEQACVEFERDLKAYLMGLLRDVHLVEDAFQKSVIKAIESADSVNPQTVRGWLFKIALNEVRESKRRASRQTRIQRAVWETMSATDNEDGLFYVISDEEKQSVREALDRLDNGYREVVVRRIQRGQSFAQIAAEMEKPLGTVLTWMRRALMQLKEMNELRRLSND